MPHALLVDDHADTLDALTTLVESEGFTVAGAATIERARAEMERQRPDAILVDLNLPDGSGLALLDALDGIRAPAVVLITGHASVDTAIEALRRGVTDYLTKPVDLVRLRSILGDIARTHRLPDEISTLKAEQQQTGRFRQIIGQSEGMLQICELISRIAPSSASVLISGESGTGKDVVAQTIHELSRRRHGPFVPVNCGAISPTLMESELFGHERGSFTGADRRHKGYFERASRGTLFLDEITEMPVELQVKLLRVLETSAFVRVGGEEPISVDVRLLAATNRSAQKAIDDGKLRADLYYRLKVFELRLPSLKDRSSDVALLANHFLQDIGRVEGVQKTFTDAALERLRKYVWPGNVRELRNVVHSAFILAGPAIDVKTLPPEVQLDAADLVARPTDADVLSFPIGTPLAEIERQVIIATLRRCEGNKVQTAEMLGVSLKTLYNRLNGYQDPAVAASN